MFKNLSDNFEQRNVWFNLIFILAKNFFCIYNISGRTRWPWRWYSFFISLDYIVEFEILEVKNEYLIIKLVYILLYHRKKKKKREKKVLFFKLSCHNQIAFSHSPFFTPKDIQKNFGKSFGI